MQKKLRIKVINQLTFFVSVQINHKTGAKRRFFDLKTYKNNKSL